MEQIRHENNSSPRLNTAQHYTYSAKELQRQVKNQRRLSDFSLVNEQVLMDGAAAPVIGSDTVTNVTVAASQRDIQKYRRVSEQLRGEHAGEQNEYGFEAQVVATQRKSQKDFNKQARVSEQFRGELAGKRNSVDLSSQGFDMAKAAQGENKKQVVNEQIIAGVGVAQLPFDTVDNVRTKIGGRQLMDVRKVNLQVRGETAGERTHFGTDSAQLSTEAEAGNVLHDYMRVSKEARGESAGKRNSFSSDAQWGFNVAKQAQGENKAALLNPQVRYAGEKLSGDQADASAFRHSEEWAPDAFLPGTVVEAKAPTFLTVQDTAKKVHDVAPLPIKVPEQFGFGEDEEGRQTPDWTRQHREDKARKEAEEQAVIAAKKNAADKAKFDAMPTWRQKLVEKTRSVKSAVATIMGSSPKKRKPMAVLTTEQTEAAKIREVQREEYRQRLEKEERAMAQKVAANRNNSVAAHSRTNAAKGLHQAPRGAPRVAQFGMGAVTSTFELL